jgi:RNA polymerase sigma-70 factor (ECF subfamily)
VPDDWQLDAELLDAWRSGDAAAGQRLFDRHVHAVARFFRNKVRDDVEDLVQQTFLRVVEGKERIRDGVAFRAYLLGIARNTLRSHLRKLSRGRDVDTDVETMAELAPGPSTVASTKREHRLLLEGLRHLPIVYQIALELHYWEGLKAVEIAPLVGLSPSAMRSRLAKARELLEASMAAIARSREVLASTINSLDGWAAEVRAQLD